MKMFLVLGTAFFGSGLLFQMPSKPPMKMGLWESASSTKMSGMQMPAGITLPTTNIKVRACMTPESYQKNLDASQNQQDCTRSNEAWSGKTYSFDLACKRGNSTGHFEMTFDSPEAGHAVMHLNMNGGHAMQMDTTIESHFVSSDCGSVSPDKPEISH